MELIPAIDLLGGRVVRLAQGDFDAVTDYGDDPVDVARRWRDEGATRHPPRGPRCRQGGPVPASARSSSASSSAVDVPCQVAGGIRDETAGGGASGRRRRSRRPGQRPHQRAGPRPPARRPPWCRTHRGCPRRPRWPGPRRWLGGRRAGLGCRDARGGARAAPGVRWFAVTAIARDGGMSGPDLGLLMRRLRDRPCPECRHHRLRRHRQPRGPARPRRSRVRRRPSWAGRSTRVPSRCPRRLASSSGPLGETAFAAHDPEPTYAGADHALAGGQSSSAFSALWASMIFWATCAGTSSYCARVARERAPTARDRAQLRGVREELGLRHLRAEDLQPAIGVHAQERGRGGC